MNVIPPLLDRLSRRTEIGFCADCLNTGEPCPDHPDDTETSTANRGTA